MSDHFRQSRQASWKIKRAQLEIGNYEKRLIFLETLLVIMCENGFDVGKIKFSDEAHFDMHGNVKKQNVRYYAKTNPNGLVCHQWTHNYSTIFFEDAHGTNVTVMSKWYLATLQNFFCM